MQLAIGAPSSPLVSNLLMYEFDKRVQTAVSSNKVVYTRYADDMTFSAPRTGYLTGVIKAVATVIRELPYPKLEINSDKTTYVTTRYHRSITGLTLSNDGRVTIGRDRKRELRSAVHRAMMDRATQHEIEELAGMLAHVNAVEPEFLEVLRRKYGGDAIAHIHKIASSGSASRHTGS
jgi:RNA-directed DNA polymerase